MIVGTVQDQAGAVVPGAEITLINEATNAFSTIKAGPNGSYVFAPVKIGTYTLSAQATGFEKTVRPQIVVNIQQRLVVDFTMVPGSVHQSIEVTSAPSLLQTQDASVGQVVGPQQINSLPLNGRNYFFLAQLNPGVTVSQQDTRGEAHNGRFSANGTLPTQNNYLLDGIDNNSNIDAVQNGRDFVVRTPIDAIAEFKVQTANYSAEFGRGAGAVVNATTKSGTNAFHGDVWEFLRNDALDANDYFLNAANRPRPEFRRNQFGFTAGGPVVIPRIYNGKNRTFVFGDFEATRIRQGAFYSNTVPTAAEISSGFTDLSQLITGQTGSQTDVLGRSFALGTIFDPATTRSVTQGQVDPVTGFRAPATGFVREPFPGNIIPANRLDANAIRLLQLLPSPNQPGILNNYIDSPVNKEGINQFDVRVDQIVGADDQIFARFSYAHDDRTRPGPFTGPADGSDSLNDANLQDHSLAAVLSETHLFSPSVVNEGRLGLSLERALFIQPFANVMGLPQQFGIQGIPQESQNGGLPEFDMGAYTRFGSFAFMPSDKHGTVYQLADNLTFVRGSHALKVGVEAQHVLNPYLQPLYSRGDLNYNGSFTSIVNKGDGTTALAQFLISPTATTVPNGVNNVGGAAIVQFSGIYPTHLGREYFGTFFQDDWKVTHRLTLNLGLRWDYFGPTKEGQDNGALFQPGTSHNAPTFWIPQSRVALLPQSFLSALTKDGITLMPTADRSWGTVQLTNLAPRFGMAYLITSKLVVRGGYGMFYGGYEEVDLTTPIVGNFPFQYSLNFTSPNSISPITPDNSIGTLESSFQNISLSPSGVKIAGVSLTGNQYHFQTPYNQNYNLTLQYQLAGTSSVSLAYVGSLGRHLIVGQTANNVTQLLPPNTNPQLFVPYPDFARSSRYNSADGISNYNALQVNMAKQLSHGLAALANFTWSKVLTDAQTCCENQAFAKYRAPDIPGFGIRPDYSPADFDVRRVFHLSGTYEFPFGAEKRFLSGTKGVLGQIVGGWATNWILTLQDGNPFSIACTTTTAAGAACYAPLVPGQSLYQGAHTVAHWMNASAFANPSSVTTIGQTDFAPLGGKPMQVVGPDFRRLDFSIFKRFLSTENTSFEFRAEFFNLTNTPNFGRPSSTNFAATASFGQITATRDAPDDQREIQFALKFYW